MIHFNKRRLTDQELIVRAIGELTLITSAGSRAGDRRHLVTSLPGVLDRGDVVAPGTGWSSVRHATAAGGSGLTADFIGLLVELPIL
jgi:hypothetical protein